ncbi:MAG: hypothetical protein OXF01_12090 [Gemmatimonadetes bacterium]|nr:hypothetical protein [Gemmatimonadota bacterium]
MISLSVAAMLLAFPGALHSSGELPSIGPALSAGEMKCTGRPGGGPEMLQWVVVLDDEVIEVSPEEFDLDDYGEARPTDIDIVAYVCWRWLDAHYGIQVSAGAVYALTREGSERHEQGQIGALEAIVAAQDRHWEEQGGYASSVGELAGFGGLSGHGLPSYFGLELVVTGEGWAARVGMTGGWDGYPEPPEKGLASACLVFVGTVPEGWMGKAADTGTALQERQPVCPQSRNSTATGPGGS